MNDLTEVFSIRTWNTYRLYVDIITSFQVPRSTKASEKYLEQERFMIKFIWYHSNDHIEKGIVRYDIRTQNTT